MFKYNVTMSNKVVRIQVRIEPELRERLDKAVEVIGVPEPVIVVRCLEAFCAYVEEHGHITLPLILAPKNQGASSVLPNAKKA